MLSVSAERNELRIQASSFIPSRLHRTKRKWSFAWTEMQFMIKVQEPLLNAIENDHCAHHQKHSQAFQYFRNGKKKERRKMKVTLWHFDRPIQRSRPKCSFPIYLELSQDQWNHLNSVRIHRMLRFVKRNLVYDTSAWVGNKYSSLIFIYTGLNVNSVSVVHGLCELTMLFHTQSGKKMSERTLRLNRLFKVTLTPKLKRSARTSSVGNNIIFYMIASLAPCTLTVPPHTRMELWNRFLVTFQ